MCDLEEGADNPCVLESAVGICGVWHQIPPLQGFPQGSQPQGHRLSLRVVKYKLEQKGE